LYLNDIFYFFYGVLRSVPDKLVGVCYLALAMLTLVLLPFLDYSYIQNSKIRIFYNYWFWFFVSNIILVSWFGAMSASEPFYFIGKLSVLTFFAEIFYIIPALNRVEILLVRDE